MQIEKILTGIMQIGKGRMKHRIPHIAEQQKKSRNEMAEERKKRREKQGIAWKTSQMKTNPFRWQWHCQLS